MSVCDPLAYTHNASLRRFFDMIDYERYVLKFHPPTPFFDFTLFCTHHKVHMLQLNGELDNYEEHMEKLQK